MGEKKTLDRFSKERDEIQGIFADLPHDESGSKEASQNLENHKSSSKALTYSAEMEILDNELNSSSLVEMEHDDSIAYDTEALANAFK